MYKTFDINSPTDNEQININGSDNIKNDFTCNMNNISEKGLEKNNSKRTSYDVFTDMNILINSNISCSSISNRSHHDITNIIWKSNNS